MKKLLFVLSLTLFAGNINAQVNPDTKMYNRADDIELGKYYQKKGKNQQIAGWVMLGGGLAMVTASGFVVWESDEGGTALALVGTISTIGSIPMFIMGAKNKGRAEILLRNTNVPLSFDARKNIPVKSVGVGIRIGK
jgi:hypothetical protein